MKIKSNYDYYSLDGISEFAKRNYQTYLAHYKERNLIPMPFEEFVKNYAS